MWPQGSFGILKTTLIKIIFLNVNYTKNQVEKSSFSTKGWTSKIFSYSAKKEKESIWKMFVLNEICIVGGGGGVTYF